MKTKLLMILTLGFSLTSKAQDLVPGNLSFNYDFQTAVLSNIVFDIENISTSYPTFGAVTVDVYIVDIGSNGCLMETVQTDVFGIQAGNSETLQIPNIDLDALCNPPTGNYYFEIEVDVNDDEAEENENNNIKTYTNQGFYFEHLNSASIDENEKLKLNIFPNPTSDIINIISDNITSNAAYSLVSIDGKIVKEGILSNTTQINVSDLTKGIYSLTVKDNDKTYVNKVIIK